MKAATPGLDEQRQVAPENPVLPAGWAWISLEHLAASEPNAITDGPFGSNLKTEHYTGGGPRVIRLQNIGDGDFLDARAHISEDHFARLGRHHVRAGDLVVAALGETLPRACVVPDHVGPALVKADCIRVRPNPELVSAQFMALALNSPYIRKRTTATVHGVGRPRLNLGEVRSIRLPIAPEPEQRRIVDEVEKQFTRLDAAVASLQRVNANLKRYRASVLKAACEGRLVPTEAELAQRDGRSFESGEELLKRILKERRARWEVEQLAKMKAAGKGPRDDSWKARYEEPVQPSSRKTVPTGWSSTSLDQLIVEPLANGRSVPDRVGGFPVLRLTCLSNGFVDLRESKEGAWTQAEAEQFHVKEGDFLIARGNGSLSLVGRGSEVRGPVIDVAFPDTLIRARVNGSLFLTSLLRQVWNSATVRCQLEALARTTAGIYKVNQDHLRGIALPLPPLPEQHRIVAEVERRLSVVDELEATVEKNLARCARLRQSILKMAFEGRLVPQDPSDEPASVLLERIKSTRAAGAVPTSSPSARSPRGRERAKNP